MISLVYSCSPSTQIQRSVQLGAAKTETALPSHTPYPTNTSPPTVTATQIPTQTLPPTDTTTPRPSPTLPLTITPTPHPTTSPTASITPTPTNTPVLPSLASLILTIDELNAFDNRWYSPAKWLLLKYDDTTKINCDIDCVGFQAEGYDDRSTLTYILYRVTDPQTAIKAVFGGETLYTTEGFRELSLTESLPPQQYSWVGVRNQREYILFISQGPVVLTIFWQSSVPLDESKVLDLLGQYTQGQIEHLRLNLYTN